MKLIHKSFYKKIKQNILLVYIIMSHTKKHHKQRHSLKTNKRGSNNFIKGTLNKGLINVKSVVKSTSKKYMPKVKMGLEKVGENVIDGSKQSVPFLQKITRKLFSVFGLKSRRK